MKWRNVFIESDTKNHFVTLLKELNVKHTRLFSNKLYSEHPHKYNLYGLSRMLSDYKIENQGIQIKNKEEVLPEIEVPFIAHVAGEFITVLKNSAEKMEYIWRDKKISTSTDDFIKDWTGIVLLAEANENSGEPDYKKHCREEYLLIAKKVLLITGAIILLGLAGYYSGIWTHIALLISLLINGVGVYISYLLLQKQLHIHSSYADRICSLLSSKSDCNNILESDASKFLGTFSWSEIGLGYFAANILIILFLPSLYPYVAFINICALPYTVWSVWYQAKVAGQWCPLCLVVQALLWLLFLCNLFSGLIQWPVFTPDSVLLIGTLYAIPILVLNLLTPHLSNSGKMEEAIQEINSMKAHETIFAALSKDQPKYEVNNSDSNLQMGNTNAKNTITVVTNPHCNPCAKMHLRLENLLEKTNQGYCIQYILSSFNEELEYSSKLLIAMHQQMDIHSFLIFMNEWYQNGKDNTKEFYAKYPFDPNDEKIIAELESHKSWLDKTKIKATPTILFNGYKLPDKYKPEDLIHFTEINLQ